MSSMLLVGLLAGGGIAALAIWLNNRNITVKWYEWLIGGLGLVLLMTGTENFFGSNAELEALAGRLYALVFGIPGLIFLTIPIRLVVRRHNDAS